MKVPTCRACGSTEIHRDAWACWDADAGQWVLGEVYDKDVWCADCEEGLMGGGESNVVWVDPTA